MLPVRIRELRVLHDDVPNVGVESEAVHLGAVNPRLSPEDAADSAGGSHCALEVGGEQEGPADDIGAADDGIGHSEVELISDLSGNMKTNLKTSAYESLS